MNYRYGLRQTGVDVRDVGYLAEAFNMPKKIQRGNTVGADRIFGVTAEARKELILDGIDKYIHEHPLNGTNFTITCFMAQCDNPTRPDGQEYTYRPSIQIKKLSPAGCSVVIRVVRVVRVSRVSSLWNFNAGKDFDCEEAANVYLSLDAVLTPLWRFAGGLEEYIYEEFGIRTNVKYEQVFVPSKLFANSFSNNRGDTVYYKVPDDDIFSDMSAEDFIGSLEPTNFAISGTVTNRVSTKPTTIFIVKTVEDVKALEEITNYNVLKIDKNVAYGITIADTADTDNVIAALKSASLPIYIKYLDLTNPACPRLHDIDWFGSICKTGAVIMLWGGSMAMDTSERPWYEDATHGIINKKYLEMCGDGKHPENYMFVLYKYNDGYVTALRISKTGERKRILSQQEYDDIEAIDEAFKMPVKKPRHGDEEPSIEDIQNVFAPVIEKEIYAAVVAHIAAEEKDGLLYVLKRNQNNAISNVSGMDFPFFIVHSTYRDENSYTVKLPDIGVQVKMESGHVVVKLLLAYIGSRQLLRPSITFGRNFLLFRDYVNKLQSFLQKEYSDNVIVRCVQIDLSDINSNYPAIYAENEDDARAKLSTKHTVPFPSLWSKQSMVLNPTFIVLNCTIRDFENFMAEFVYRQNTEDEFILCCVNDFVVPEPGDINPNCNINFICVQLLNPLIPNYEWVKDLCRTPDCKIIFGWGNLVTLAKTPKIKTIADNTKGVITGERILKYAKKINAFIVRPTPTAIYSPRWGTLTTSTGENIPE